MQVGSRIAERWEVVAPAAAEPSVGRWRAVSVETGEPVDILALQPPAVHPPAANQAFLDVHREVQRARDPALVRVHATTWEGPVGLVVREPLEDATLDEVAGPLPPSAVAAIGARLVPAVLAAGPATGSALHAADLGIDARGHPVLAPRGRPAARVRPEDTRWVAPEAFGGAHASGAGGLYGLGVTLYRLATGRDPQPARGGTGTPIPAGNYITGMPLALDEALQRLLSPDPGERAGALPLLQEVAGEVPDLRVLARRRTGITPATLVPGEVKVTATAEGREALRDGNTRLDVPRPRAGVVVPARDLIALDPAARSAAAGWAGAPLEAMKALQGSGLPLVLEAHRSKSKASDRARALGVQTGLPVQVVQPAGWSWPLAMVVFTALSAGLLVLGLAAFLPLLLVAALCAGFGLVAVTQWWGQRNDWSRFLAAWQAQRAGGKDPAELMHGRERVASLRRRLAEAEIPETAAMDVRAALKDVEHHLDELARIGATVEGTLATVDATQLRSRLASLSSRGESDPDAAEERDRIAHTLADVEAVQERRQRLQGDLVRIDDALDDLAAVLGEIATRREVAPGAVERLRMTTRLAREALREDPDPPSRIPPERERT
ncbi:MAG: hypothetical protein JRJ84_04845 [Deltaproteobacteria bacterium]|nr:hypothetical protein [Deltaproteobacteria bacterium]